LCGSDPQVALAEMDGAGFRTPAARCALETALLDLLTQHAGVPLARSLNARAPLAVRVNAAIGAFDDKVLERAREAADAGFSVLKLKIGLAAPEIELAALRRLADELPPGAVLRLDANGAWSWDQARHFIEGLAGLPVESLEEPLARPDIGGLAHLQALAAFPLALDESLGRLALLDVDTLLASAAVRRLVLKPMVLGGVVPAYALACRAVAAGMECVATSTVDSAVGVAAATHLAVALDNDLAHGVATASWLSQDVGKSPHLVGGWMYLDKAMSGLGFFPSVYCVPHADC
jgi:L-alanine-DL-glutamate epimerase-like enolase superfamily enzyme